MGETIAIMKFEQANGIRSIGTMMKILDNIRCSKKYKENEDE
jgi:hypothetical protein